MASKSQSHGVGVMEDVQSSLERAADWVRGHLLLVSIGLVAILIAAAGVGWRTSQLTQEAENAADALDRVTTNYLLAMGAAPGALEVPELANPAAAEAIRSEYAEKYGEVAAAHPGTVASALAALEQGNLLEASGDLEASIAVWQEAVGTLGGNPKLQAMLHQRIGQAYEAAGSWSEAAAAHELAGASEDYPLRYWALADAMRCFVQAGEAQRARDLALQIDAEAPDLELPEHARTLVRELRQTQSP